MTNRDRDIDLLFQRLEAARPGARDPNAEQEAARAIEAWPLLAILAPRAEVLARAAPSRIETVAAEAAGEPIAPRFEIEPPPPPVKPVSPLDQLFARLERDLAAKTAEPVVADGVAVLRPAALDKHELARQASEEAMMRQFEKAASR